MSTSTMFSRSLFAVVTTLLVAAVAAVAVAVRHQTTFRTAIHRNTSQNTLEITQRFSEQESAKPNFKFTDRSFVVTCSFLQDGDRLANGALGLEVPEQDDRVREVTHIYRR